MKNLIKVCLVSLLCLGVATGCNQSETEKPVLRMGTSADYKPFQFIDTAISDDIIGFDIDIAQYIADELGYELEVIDMDFNTLTTALRSERVDMVLAGMTPTPQRREEVDFTDIYYSAQSVLMTLEGVEINQLEDLNGLNIGVQTGSIQEDAGVALQESGIDVQLTSMDRMPELVQQLIIGRVDAVIIEDMVTPLYLENDENLQLIDILEQTHEGSAVAIRYDSELKDQINEILQQMSENGELERLSEKWFN